MGEFFKGWRRKIGIVTLLMACVFMAGWVRSLAMCDVFRFPTGQHTCDDVFFVDNTVVWRRNYEDQTEFVQKSLSWDRRPISDFHPAEEDRRIPWIWRQCGFGWYERWQGWGIGKIKDDPRDTLWIIPYRVIVIPLTLLSAILLLSKPRQFTSKKTPEPTPNERATS